VKKCGDALNTLVCTSGKEIPKKLEINMHHLPEAMQYRQATRAEAIRSIFCVVEGFVGQRPNSDSNVRKIFLIFLLNLAHVFVSGS